MPEPINLFNLAKRDLLAFPLGRMTSQLNLTVGAIRRLCWIATNANALVAMNWPLEVTGKTLGPSERGRVLFSRFWTLGPSGKLCPSFS